MPRVSIFAALIWLFNRLIPLGLVLAALVGLWWLGQLNEPKVLDLFQRWEARPASKSPVVLVLLDNESLVRLQGHLGPPPWSRQTLIEILKRVNAAHPAVMALDSQFVNGDRVQDDRVLTRLRQFPRLITGMALPDSALSPVENRFGLSISDFESLNLGIVSMPEDPDGVIRTMRLFYRHDAADKPENRPSAVYPSLAFATALAYHRWQGHPDSQTFWGIPADHSQPSPSDAFSENPVLGAGPPEARFFLHWLRPLNTPGEEGTRAHQAIPLYRFFDASAPPNLQGKIALIGASASYYRDYHQTPLSHHHLGPDIQATAIDNLLVTPPVFKNRVWENLLLLLGASGLIFLGVMAIQSLGRAFLYATTMGVLFFWAAWQVFSILGCWWDVVTTEFFIGASFLAANVYRTRYRETQLIAMEKTLSQLVDPGVLREIRRRADSLKPGGEKLEITSLFVDIRQFTALSERLQPMALTALLNAFYESVVTVVFQHQGTVDKFMGDGILVIFGAPLPRADHATQALRAALDLLSAMEALCRQWRETQHLDVEIGISLHSGTAFVGFLGPVDKLEYTAVGDTVNTCIRLQEALKAFQTRLIVSQQTLQDPSALEGVQFESLGEVQVRGREASIHVYTVAAARVR